MPIDRDNLRAAADELVETLLQAVDGYGENAYPTALALVVRIRSEPTPEHPVDTGQTILFPNVAPGAPEEDRRAYLVHMLEEAVQLARRQPVDPRDLPPLE